MPNAIEPIAVGTRLLEEIRSTEDTAGPDAALSAEIPALTAARKDELPAAMTETDTDHHSALEPLLQSLGEFG
jgi:hypothetical protein